MPSGSDQSSPEGPESSPTDETSDDKPVKLKDLKEETNKTEQSSGKEVTQDDTITELVVISEDSPKKLKYPLGKARSAGLLEASNTDSGSSPEFTGVRSRPQRAMSEKSANKVQTGQLEKPGKDDTHQNESMYHCLTESFISTRPNKSHNLRKFIQSPTFYLFSNVQR